MRAGGRYSRTRLSRCRADNDTAKNRDIRINNVFMVYGVYMNDDLSVTFLLKEK